MNEEEGKEGRIEHSKARERVGQEAAAELVSSASAAAAAAGWIWMTVVMGREFGRGEGEGDDGDGGEAATGGSA